MSVAGVSTVLSTLSQLLPSGGNPHRQIHAEFQQLGNDLATGNLTQAQTDYAALAQTVAPSQAGSTASAAQAFTRLGQDLQSGNVTAAQQDFTRVQQDFQQASATLGHSHHHHHHAGAVANDSANSSQQASDIATLFAELGQSLQAGNLSAAQQTYSSLQQDLLQFSANSMSSAAAQPAGLNLIA